MAKKRRPGKGAKGSLLTRFIHPKIACDKNDRAEVVLEERKEMEVNKKYQMCYTFKLVGDDENIYHAVKSHVRIEEEGPKKDLFDPAGRDLETNAFKEPKIKWRKSLAKELLYERIIDGSIPLDPADESMSLEEIYSVEAEFNKYSFEQFGDRLNKLRENIIGNTKRADEDLAAFENYIENHEVSLFSHKGYAQWQGSTAQELLWDDLDEYRNNPNMKPKDLWLSREEYHQEWPLHAFRSKLEQEIRTAKYLHTMKTKGTRYKAS